MAFKAYSPKSPDELWALSLQNQHLKVTSQLSSEELNSSASRWTRRHLIAYRLLVQPEAKFLPILKTDHDTQCPVCKPGKPCSQTLDQPNTQSLLRENPRNLSKKTDSELIRLPEGFFWVALAEATRPKLDGLAKMHPKRDRKQVEREGYTNSTEAIPGSSSPIQHSVSEYEGESSLMNEDEHDDRQSKPEDVTVNLVHCFLRYALAMCLIQHASSEVPKTEVRLRIERKSANASVGDASITAEDDGGICRADRGELGWQIGDNYLALLEAKRAFRGIDFDEKREAYVPIVSDENVAQCLGEAVITWKANQDLLGNHVFLIAATNTFVRFICFGFGRDYLTYLDTTGDEAAQMEFADPGRDAFVYMQSTKWFNLQTPKERKVALCHIMALLRWHDLEEGRKDIAASNESMDIGE